MEHKENYHVKTFIKKNNKRQNILGSFTKHEKCFVKDPNTHSIWQSSEFKKKKWKEKKNHHRLFTRHFFFLNKIWKNIYIYLAYGSQNMKKLHKHKILRKSITIKCKNFACSLCKNFYQSSIAILTRSINSTEENLGHPNLSIWFNNLSYRIPNGLIWQRTL